MRFYVVLAWLLIGFYVQPALAVPDDSQLQGELVAAIEALVGNDQDDLFFKGNVSEPEQKQETILAGGGQISLSTDGLTKEFRGEIEIASQPKREEFAIVSTQDILPSMAVYDNGQDTYQSIIFRGESVSAVLLLSDLRQLTDRDNLLKFIGRAKAIKKTKGDAGEMVYSCSLSKRILRDSPTNLLTINGKVKSIEAAVTLKDGLIRQITFSVTRPNPFLDARDASSASETQPDAAVPDDFNIDELLRSKLKDPVVVYELTPIETPSQRTMKMTEQLRAFAQPR